MQIQPNTSLKEYNTFGIDVMAKYFATFNSIQEINELLEFKELSTINHQLSTLVLGGGSNILFTKNFDGIVLKNGIKGIEVIKEDDDHVYVKAITKNKEFLIRSSLQAYAENFDPRKFFRIGKSHIINVDHIQKMDGASVTIDGKVLPMSKQFRDELLKRLRLG